MFSDFSELVTFWLETKPENVFNNGYPGPQESSTYKPSWFEAFKKDSRLTESRESKEEEIKTWMRTSVEFWDSTDFNFSANLS